MKQHPATTDALDKRSWDSRRLETKVAQIVSEVAKDEDARGEWMARQTRYYRRRYVRYDRRTDYPWPGAADIVIPTIDMTVDRLKATISRVLFTRPMVNFKARSALGQRRVQAEKQYFEWLLTNKIRDFKDQAHFLLDDVLQTGIGIAKVVWDYQTERRQHILRSSHLPSKLRKIIDQAVGSAAEEGRPGTDGLSPDSGLFMPTKEQIKRAMEDNRFSIERTIAEELNLEPKERDDGKAIKEVFKLFTGEAKEVRYTTKEVLANNPKLIAVEHQDFVVPSCTKDIQQAPRITHKIFLTEPEFRARARDQKWMPHRVKSVLDRKQADDQARGDRIRGRGGRTEADDARRDREGILTDYSTDLIEIWEHYRWEDLDGDGKPERVSFLIHPKTSTVLADPQGLFYSHGLFPFVDLRLEMNSGRYYSSRGIPEKLDDIDHEITQRHRAKLNKLELMVPAYKYRQGSNLDPSKLRFRPGAMFPVLRMDDIEPIVVPDYSISDEREENVLETMVQRYIGALDTGLTSTKNLSEARTATEISAIQRAATEALSAKVEIIMSKFRQIYQMVWDLDNQWGSSREFRLVTGEERVRLSPEQIKNDFEIEPVGSVLTTDPQIEEQKAFQRLEVLMKVASMPPELIGDRYAMDVGEALHQWITRSSPNDAKLVLRERTPEEIKKVQESRAAIRDAAKRLEENAGITPEEQKALNKETRQVSKHGAATQIIAGGAR